MTSLVSWTTCPVEFRVTIGQHQYSQAENSWLKSQKLGVKITLPSLGCFHPVVSYCDEKTRFFPQRMLCLYSLLTTLSENRTKWRSPAMCTVESSSLLFMSSSWTASGSTTYLLEEFGLDHFESRAFTFSWMVKHFGKLQLTQHTSVKLENTNSPRDYKSLLLSVSRIMHTGYVPKMLEFHLCLTHPLLAQSIFQKVIYCSSEGSSIFEISHLAVNEIKIWSWLNLSITCSWAKTIKTVLSN